MIIPIKCFTCGHVLADKYNFYKKTVAAEKSNQGEDVNKVIYLTEDNIKKTIEGKVMDDLGLTKMCCRRHFLTHVDIIG
jgi:DNA-directed RNA polymerase subunit N (RpoN/RPB10)|tara:strand:+ start:5862 stop:6098 length:237 start_codon:yes stop_codon:yes gene_type:complete